ncbi:MAG: NAD(P)H-hydrate dehydratase [Alphaproteobacteria bacterium]
MPKQELLQNNVSFWLDDFPRPQRDDNKYTRGCALIYGGNIMTGAARLAARAAQRIGAGLVTLVAPPEAVPIYAEALESVIVRSSHDQDDTWQTLLSDTKTDVILIGPGLGLSPSAKQKVLQALATTKPCVLDADALTNFSDHPSELISHLHSQCILTPHQGEFDRLFGKQIDKNAEKASRVKRAAELTGCVVLLKGADTIIATPAGHILLNNNGTSYLATAGSGDVLAGMILGLLAQGMPLFKATAAAAWLHGKIATDFGPGLIAEDIISGIPATLKSMLFTG